MSKEYQQAKKDKVLERIKDELEVPEGFTFGVTKEYIQILYMRDIIAFVDIAYVTKAHLEDICNRYQVEYRTEREP